MADHIKALELLFDRPSEPIIMPKGEDGYIFDLDEKLLVSYYFTTLKAYFESPWQKFPKTWIPIFDHFYYKAKKT